MGILQVFKELFLPKNTPVKRASLHLSLSPPVCSHIDLSPPVCSHIDLNLDSCFIFRVRSIYDITNTMKVTLPFIYDANQAIDYMVSISSLVAYDLASLHCRCLPCFYFIKWFVFLNSRKTVAGVMQLLHITF